LGIIISIFVSVTCIAKPPTAEHPYDVTILGAFNIYGSLSKQSVELIYALQDDLTISFIPTSELSSLHYVTEAVQKVVNTSGLTKKGKVLLVEDRHYSVPPEGLFEKYGLPAKDKKQLRLVYDMAETSRISKDAADVLNLYDAVLVPDPFLIDVFASSGVKVPIFVLPLGMYIDDLLESEPVKRDRVPFVFGNFGYLQERKNQILLVQAFAKAFGNNPDVQLWLSARGAFENYEKAVRAEIEKLGLTNVVVENSCYTRTEYINKFKKINCYVNISTGEGFSYQPRESMLLGVPVIVSDNTAQTTICASGHARAVPSNILVPYVIPEFGHYYQCSIEDVAEALIDVYANPEKYGTLDAKKWAEQYDFSNLKPLYLSALSPKKIIFGEKNEITTSHVQTNSKKLYKKLTRIFTAQCS
jgi:glycosyltransferase involved in cell wall biosynthesis